MFRRLAQFSGDRVRRRLRRDLEVVREERTENSRAACVGALQLAIRGLDRSRGIHGLARRNRGRRLDREDWKRRIRALAEVDSMGAAEEVLKLPISARRPHAMRRSP